MVSPTLNAYGQDRPVSVAVSIDSLEPQTTYFIPYAVPGSLPAQWDGTDGFVADSIVVVPNTFSIAPGAHTLKVSVLSPTFLCVC